MALKRKKSDGTWEIITGILGLDNTLDSDSESKALTAKQGKVLKGMIESTFDLIYPIGSYAFGVMPSLGTWEEITGDKALWINNEVADGTAIEQSLPKPSISISNAGSHSHTVNSAGAHTHSMNGYHNMCTDEHDRECLARWEISGESCRTTGSAGYHMHTMDQSPAHSHTATVNTTGAYGDGAKVQPDAYVIKVYRRTA